MPLNQFIGSGATNANVFISKLKTTNSQAIKGTKLPEFNNYTVEQIQEMEHQYPFFTQIKTEPKSSNTEQFRLSVKRPDQFEDPKKLSQYISVLDEHELGSSVDRNLYKSASHTRSSTRGRFQSDPDMAKAVKTSAELSRKENENLISRNESLKELLAKANEKEMRSLRGRKESHIAIDDLIKKEMARKEKKLEIQSRRMLR